MKILLFRTDPSVMNIKNYNSQEIGLAKAYISLGHQCDIVYYNGSNKSRIEYVEVGEGNNIRIFWMKGFSILNNGFFPGITKLAKQYDVIQVSEYYFWSSWYIYNRFGKTKKVYVYQGVYDADNSKRYQLRCKVMDPFMLSKSVKQNTQIFTKSKLAEESMRIRGFVRVKTVGVGLDKTRLAESAAPSEWTQKLIAAKENKTYLLYVGVLEDRRNILFLLDIFNAVCKTMPDIRLVIVGKGQAAYVESCMDRIRELHLQDYVIYKDSLPQQELCYVYQAADMFLLPTKYEIFGMVIMEAMNYGLPIITSHNGGSSTLIRSNENGVIVNDFDVQQWSASIVDLLNDPYKAAEIGKHAAESSQNDFSWKQIAQNMLSEITR